MFNSPILIVCIIMIAVLTCSDKTVNSEDTPNDPPIISDLYRSHEIPEPRRDIEFRATIVDPDSDQTEGFLYYNVGEGYNSVEMTQDDSITTLYSATISRLPAETHCNYYILAEDVRGARSFSDTLEFDVVYWFPTLYTFPPVDSISLSGSSRIRVRLGRVIDFFAVSLIIPYDSTIVDIDTVLVSDPGIWEDPAPLLFYQKIDGQISIAAGAHQTDENDNITGFGGLFDIYFRGIGVGEATIDFTDVLLVDENGAENRYHHYLETISATIYVH